MAQASWWTRATAFLRSRTDEETSPNDNGTAKPRLVIDTNIFIAAVRAPGSSSRQLLDAVSSGKAMLLVSPAVFREYRNILPKAVQSREREQLIRDWLALAQPVDASRGPRVVPDDPDDDKFVSLALQGQADAIVSNDEHLLGLGDRISVPVLRPGDAVGRINLQ